jgi:hypothetical protein
VVLAGSTTKKAVIQRFDRSALPGYVNPVSFVQPGGIELLSAEGVAATIPFEEVRLVAFVRDFEPPETERRAVFQTRPKMEGLWISLEFRDGQVMEGILPNNLLQLDPSGFTITPPDTHGNAQRIFVPKAAVRSVQVLGVVGSPLKRRRPKAADKDQIRLFDQ